MLLDLHELPAEGANFDVVVLGAGGAGMAAALCAAIDGARVLLVERTEFVGGTTALSGGTTWIPGTRHGAAVGAADTHAAAAQYLDTAVGDRAPQALRRAFLAHGPEAVVHVEANSAVKFRAYPLHPDYLSELPGSTVKGRALEPLPFDGRQLGPLLALVRPPIPEFTVLRGMMVDRTDIFHLLRMTRSAASFRHSAGILARHGADLLRYRRGTRLVMGNALVARLLHSLAQRDNVSLLVGTAVERMHCGGAGVTAVTLAQAGERRTVRVSGGVILATGGFNRHPELRKQMLPGIPVEWCPAATGHTGHAHDLVRPLGAHYGEGAQSHAFWAPVSLRSRADGGTGAFPHFLMDRGKPGMIAVDKSGRRFVNETTSYHLFALAMQQRNTTTAAIPAYLIADTDAVRKYGIGMVRPGGKHLASFIADGYLTEAATLDGLAAKLGVDGGALRKSVTRFNEYAQAGVDPEFHRGTTAYERNLGDAAWKGPNPCLGPLQQPPFYAVRLYPGDIGAATGFATDGEARVLDTGDQPIAGLYAVGNDMQSVMGGVYTGPGITIGPGLVFGYLAGRHAAERSKAGIPVIAPATLQGSA
ncbi:MAG: FAD-dependent oxidoreductase [Casimicrobiaceae bacterium]